MSLRMWAAGAQRLRSHSRSPTGSTSLHIEQNPSRLGQGRTGSAACDSRPTFSPWNALPQAVAASAAIPVLFVPVHIPGRNDGPFIDGGKADRVGLDPWLRHCEETGKPIAPMTICHVIARSTRFSGRDR